MPPKPPDKKDLSAVVVCFPDSASVSDAASDMDPMMCTFSGGFSRVRRRSWRSSRTSVKWQVACGESREGLAGTGVCRTDCFWTDYDRQHETSEDLLLQARKGKALLLDAAGRFVRALFASLRDVVVLAFWALCGKTVLHSLARATTPKQTD